MKSGVYLIKCTANGRQYVGSSKDIDKRWSSHRAGLKYHKHDNNQLQKIWNKYGRDSFEWSILELTEPTESVLFDREQHWIDILHPEINVYQSVLYGNRTEEEKKRTIILAKKNLIKWNDLSEDEREERKAKLRRAWEDNYSKRCNIAKQIGIAKTEKHRDQLEAKRRQKEIDNEMRKLERDRIAVERAEIKKRNIIERESTKEQRRAEWREKLRAVANAQWSDPAYRAKHQKATRKAMKDPDVLKRLSESHKGIIITAEHRKKIGDAHRGMKRPPETGRKISAAKMGHTVSEETRRKISETKRRQQGAHRE